VGICAEEYRDGELISTARRDFQYNVGICGQTTSAFFAPDIQCDGLEVFATNQSEGTNIFRWLFGDPNAPLGISTEENPSFLFPDFGTYSITLIAAAGEVCADTFSQDIQLLPLSLQPAFAIDTISCGDSLVLQLTDLSEDSLSTITAWEWTLNNEVVSTSQSPLITISEAGNYEIGLNLSAANGCQNSLVGLLDNISFIEEALAADSLFLCPGDSIFLNPVFEPQYNYQWSPAMSLSQSDIPNPLAFPDTTTTYQLLLTDASGNCSAERNITIIVPLPLSMTISPDTVTCADTVLLVANSSTAVRYFWSPFSDFSTAVVADSIFSATPIGLETYYVQVFDEAGCSLIDSVSVNSLAVNLAIPTLDTAICLGEQVLLQVNNMDPADELSYSWAPAELIISGGNSATPIVQPDQSGVTVINFISTNQHDCSVTDSIVVTAVDPLQFGADVHYQQCSGRRVDFTANDPAAALYQWHFGDPQQINATAEGASVSHDYSTAGVFQVMITLPTYLACADTVFLEVMVSEEGTVSPDFSWSYITCDETATILVSDESIANGTFVESWQWYQDDTLVSEEHNFTFTLDTTTTTGLSLITLAANGCIDTISQLLTIPLIELNLADQLLLCPGESVFLNPGGNPAYDYLWSPGTGLSDSTAANPLATPLSATNYSLTVSDPASICLRTAAVQVDLSASPAYFLSPDTLTCATSVQLFVEADEPLSYTWAADPDFLTPLSNDEFLEVTTEPQTFYYLEIIDSQNCRFIDSVLVDGRGVALLLPPEQLVCLADTISLVASSANDYPISEYLWSPSAVIIGPDNEAEVRVAPTENTIVGLSVSNLFGCELDTFVRINLLSELPFLDVMPLRDTLLPGESVQLFATEQADYSYEWSPATGLNSTTIFNPFASPEETTTYQVLIRDENGCENIAEVILIVFNSPCQAPYIYVPNAFTPNGDFLNDVLRVEGNVIDEFYFVIYDRWGEKVFESFNQNEVWDGTYQGRNLTSDVYGYLLEVSCFDGVSYITKGNISLIR
jgi:gliding motility-associated-like protein